MTIKGRRTATSLSLKEVLDAVDAFHRRTGRFPTQTSGVAIPKHGISWESINRRLANWPFSKDPTATSLHRLVCESRGLINLRDLPRLTKRMVLEWARAHRRRTGDWPDRHAGPIPGSFPGDTWSRVDAALYYGRRGMKGGSSLARLLADHGYSRLPYHDRRARLTFKRILELADMHRRRTGRWPTPQDGRVVDDPHEHWMTIDESLKRGRHGLPSGWTLRKLLHKYRRRKTRIKCPDVTEAQIARWAERHFRVTGEWPLRRSGPVIDGLQHDTWRKLDFALIKGSRSLPGGSSLPRLLFEQFGIQRRSDVFLKKKRRPGRVAPREGSSLDWGARRPDEAE